MSTLLYYFIEYGDGTAVNDFGNKYADGQTNVTLPWVKVTADQEDISESYTLREITIALDPSKKLTSFATETKTEGVKKIMAITLVGAQGEERFAEIETKIAALPELDAVTTGDISAITEVEEMILMAQKEGADITKIANIEKFNDLKRYKKVMSKIYTPVDISGNCNGIGYLSAETSGTIENPTAPNYFIAKNGDNVSDPRAFSLESINATIKTDGYLHANGVPYKVVNKDNQKSTVASGWANYTKIQRGYYKEAKILYAASNKSVGNNSLYYYTDYSDGTTVNNFSNTYADGSTDVTLPWVKVSADQADLNESYTLREITIQLNPDKELVKFATETKIDGVKKIMAITLVGVSGGIVSQINEKIEALPQAEEITSADFAAIHEIEELIEDARVTGEDLNAIVGMDKFETILAKKDEIFDLDQYVTIDLNYNSKSFLTSAQAGTVADEDIAGSNYFLGNTLTATDAFALNKDNVLPLLEGNILYHNYIPYKMNILGDDKDSCNLSGITIPSGQYEEIKVLVATSEPSNSEYGRVYTGLTYQDGTLVNGSFATKKHDDSNKENLVVTAGTVSAKTKALGTNGNIYEYTIVNKRPKDVLAKLAFASSNPPAGTRILAVTLKKYKAPVLVEEATLTNGENITINITFKNAEDPALLTKENIKLINRAGELDYTITPVLEGDKATGVILTTKNSLKNDKNYQLSMDFGNDKTYGNAFVALNPVTLSGYELINSDGETVSKVADITDGKLYVKPMVENNVYTEAKTVKVIAAVYDGTKLEAVKTANPSIAMGTPYNEAMEVIIPTEGLTDTWNVQVYVWDEDMITPVTVKKKITYAADTLEDTTKDITVAFIGGSITEGGNITYPFVQKWQAERSGKITYINAGQGGTKSDYGAMRLYEEVLSKNPDVVFIDFAGNDHYSTDAQIKANAEAMIKQIEAMEHQPVVIPWFWPHRNIASYVASHNAWEEASEYYGLNILDTHTLCVTEIEKGNATWDDYTLATDVHPNKTQGEKIAELAFNEFIQNADKYIRSIKMMPKKYGSDDYTKPCHVSSSDLDYASYDENWSDTKVDDVVTEGYNVPTSLPFKSFMASATTGATMTFKFSGTKLIISSLMGKLGRSASYTITNSDGVVEKSGSISNYIADYNWYENVILSLTGLEDTEHTLTVTVKDGTGIFGIGDFWIDE